jgi:hypothetical protein
MNKTKLAVCMKDLEYQKRFVNCFINHYKHQYELHVFTNLEQLLRVDSAEYAVIITGEYTTDEIADFVERGEILLNLTENLLETRDASKTNLVYTEKYQEVYKIADVVERLVTETGAGQGVKYRDVACECIGIYSLTQEMYQIPFAALLGELHGGNQKVLVLDLQTHSGFSAMAEGMTSMGLEDLLSAVISGNYSRGRILECIRHEASWDYIGPVQNSQCLVEGTKTDYDVLLKLLVEEIGYQKIIINFGTAYMGQLEMMEQCQQVYFLSSKDAAGSWRETAFLEELARQEKEVLLQKIRKIEIPLSTYREAEWKPLVEKWNWGYIGELLRQGMEKERHYGTVM